MSDEFTARLSSQLLVEEGKKERLYRDPKGFLTIGVGRNIETVGLRPGEAELMLQNDIAEHIKFMSQFEWYTQQSDVRRAALIDMSFMGPERLLKFVLMIAALVKQDFTEARVQCIDSQWYKDVGPERGNRVADMILTGAWPADIPYGVAA